MPKQAWLYAASWGSYIRNGDPGACMYGFNEHFRVQSEDHREAVRSYLINHCRPGVLAHPEDYERTELAQMDSFLATLASAPVAVN